MLRARAIKTRNTKQKNEKPSTIEYVILKCTTTDSCQALYRCISYAKRVRLHTHNEYTRRGSRPIVQWARTILTRNDAIFVQWARGNDENISIFRNVNKIRSEKERRNTRATVCEAESRAHTQSARTHKRRDTVTSHAYRLWRTLVSNAHEWVCMVSVRKAAREAAAASNNSARFFVVGFFDSLEHFSDTSDFVVCLV